MKLPFLQRDILALCLTDKGIDWAFLSATGRKITDTDAGFREHATGAGWETAASLIEERGWQHVEVIIRLNPNYVRHFLIEGSVVSSIEEFDEWMSAEIASQLPAGAEIQQFVFRSRVLHQDDEVIRCMVGLARRDYIENEIANLAKAGIAPVKLSGLFAELDQYYSTQGFEEALGYAVLVDDRTSICLAYQNGVLSSLNSFEGINGQWQQELESVLIAIHTGSEVGAMRIAGVTNVLQELPNEELTLLGVNSEAWLWNKSNHDVPPAAMAQSLVAWGGIERHSDFNFLDEDDAKVQIHALEKASALKVMLSAGAVLGILLALVLVSQVIMSRHLFETEDNLSLMQNQIAVLEKQQQSIASLQLKLKDAHRFIDERTDVANVISVIGKAMPKGVWLNDIQIDKDTADHWRIILQGNTVEGAGIALLLGNLEGLPGARKVELLVSERLPASKLFKRDKVKNINVSRFDILIELPKSIHESVQPKAEAI